MPGRPQPDLTLLPAPHPVQFRGSRMAAGLLRLGGWRVHFQGLPALQGVAIVYPHTSNWDFIVMILAKWAMGVPVQFWGKDALFRIPLFGRWLRWLGGVPVARTSAQGTIASAVAHFEACKAAGSYCWVGLAPEGTRKALPGLRSGFYRTAVGADVPLAVVALDYGRKQVRVEDFVYLSGNEAADLPFVAALLQGTQGKRPAEASPVRLLDRSVARTDTIVK